MPSNDEFQYGVNKEGADAFITEAPVSLYNTASSFIYKNGGYFTQKDRLETLESDIRRNVAAGDKDFVVALAWFMGSVQGLRLSPTIMLSRLVYDGTLNLRNESDYNKAKMIVDDVFTRPDFIANSLSYYKLTHSVQSIANVNPLYKGLLRDKLASYKPLTLKKRKMKSREIRLADLIKVLRPKPKNAEMSKLYKAIIENDPLASLKVEVDENNTVIKADSGVAVLSDSSVPWDKKLTYLINNINSLPINELIRNMSTLPPDQYRAVAKRIKRAFKSIDSARFINPFDLILLERASFLMAGDEYLRAELDTLLEDIIIDQINFNVKRPVVLVDISGSMKFDINGQRAINIAVKYLSLILPILLKSGCKGLRYYEFDTRLHKNTDIVRNAMEMGRLKLTPHGVAKFFLDRFAHSLNGGTSLRNAVYNTVKSNPNCDGLFIFTDEVSWSDTRTVRTYNNLIPNKLKNRTFVFNVDPDQHTMFNKGDSITRISGTNSNSLFLLNAMLDFDSFKKNLITLFNSKLVG